MHSISIGSWDTSPFKPVFITCPADHLCLDFITCARRSAEWQGAPNLLHLLRTHKLAKETRFEIMSQELIYINRWLAGVSHLWLGKERRTRQRGKIISQHHPKQRYGLDLDLNIGGRESCLGHSQSPVIHAKLSCPFQTCLLLSFAVSLC